MPSLTRNIEYNSPLSIKLLERLRALIEMSRDDMREEHKRWRRAEELHTAYVVPQAEDEVKNRRREDLGIPDYSTIVLPYSYAQAMTFQTYMASVFLGREPLWMFRGRHGEAQTNEQAIEALLDYQRANGCHVASLLVFFNDVCKYGVGVIGYTWEKQSVVSSHIQEITDPLGITPPKKLLMSQRIPTYEGTRLFNVRPYDFYPDTRVTLLDFQRGEFAALYHEVSYYDLVREEEDGYVIKSALKALRTKGPHVDNARQDSGRDSRLPGQDTRGSQASYNHVGTYGRYSIIVELIPDEWDLSSSRYPEKWEFCLDCDYDILLSARPTGSLHGKFPYVVQPYEPAGYVLETRGIYDVLKPIQETIDFLVNSHFFNVRETLNNTVIVDPTMVDVRSVANPVKGRIILRSPAATNIPRQNIYDQIPVADVTRQHMADIAQLNDFGQRVTGIMDQMQGIATGGRKSASEFRGLSGFATSRQRTLAQFYTAVSFSPLAAMLLSTTQQYYTGEQKFRLVGSLASLGTAGYIDVTPEQIAGNFDYVPVDPSMPTDRFAMSQFWRQLLVDISNIPALLKQFDLGKIINYIAHLNGITNVEQFKLQMASPEAIMQMQDAGNIVPMQRAPQARAQDTGAIG